MRRRIGSPGANHLGWVDSPSRNKATFAERRLLPLAIPLALTACGASSGIVPVGPDTYFLSEMRAQAIGGGGQAEAVVLAEAATFCQRQGRSVALLDVQPGGDPRGDYWPTAFDATFRCVVRPGTGNCHSRRPADGRRRACRAERSRVADRVEWSVQSAPSMIHPAMAIDLPIAAVCRVAMLQGGIVTLVENASSAGHAS